MKPSDRQELEKKLASALNNSPLYSAKKNRKKKRGTSSTASNPARGASDDSLYQTDTPNKVVRFDSIRVLLRKIRLRFSLLHPATRALLLPMLILAIWFVNCVGNYTLAWMRADVPPDAILVLGGGPYREIHGIQAAYRLPHASLIISSGGAPHCSYEMILEHGGVAANRLLLDMRATDTLTNYTASLPLLEELEAKNVLVISSKGHWARAGRLASIVLGSHGIAHTPYLVESDKGNDESDRKTMLDTLRAMLWVAVGEPVVLNHYAPEDADHGTVCHTYSVESIKQAIREGIMLRSTPLP